jgi:hypothetical protein
MNKEKLKLLVLKKIKGLKVAPIPKWQFILKDWIVWASFAVSVVIGSIAFSVSVFMLETNDWNIRRMLDDSLLKFAFRTLPYLWIIIFIAFIFIGYYNLRHTKKGYKYSFILVVGVNLLATVILGYALFGIGAAKRIDSFALDRIPVYERVQNEQRKELWSRPGQGLIAGEIKKIVRPNGFTLNDFNNNEWNVILNNNQLPDRILREGSIVQVIGTKVGQFEFEAEMVRPWQRNLPMQRSPERPPSFRKGS